MEFFEFRFDKADFSQLTNTNKEEEDYDDGFNSINNTQNCLINNNNNHFEKMSRQLSPDQDDISENMMLSDEITKLDGGEEEEDAKKMVKKTGTQEKRAFYTSILQNQMELQINIQMLGEIMIDINLFTHRPLKSSYEFNQDYPWNAFRPASKIQNFQDGSMMSYHDASVLGKLFFEDILQILNQIPDQNAHKVAQKLEKYQKKITQTQQVLKQLKEYYSEEDLFTIFTEIQNVSLEKAMMMLESYGQSSENNQVYMYGIHTINPNNLLMAPLAIGQSSQLVELLGGNYDAYKLQMLRKGFLNFNSMNSHLQMLLLSIGVEKQVYLEARTIEGFQLPMTITIENHSLQSLKLNPVDFTFHTVLTVYKIHINPNIIDHLNFYRKSHSYEGLPDDLSYMLDCQIFLQKHYKEKFDLSSERRCHYRLINSQ